MGAYNPLIDKRPCDTPKGFANSKKYVATVQRILFDRFYVFYKGGVKRGVKSTRILILKQLIYVLSKLHV